MGPNLIKDTFKNLANMFSAGTRFNKSDYNRLVSGNTVH